MPLRMFEMYKYMSKLCPTSYYSFVNKFFYTSGFKLIFVSSFQLSVSAFAVKKKLLKPFYEVCLMPLNYLGFVLVLDVVISLVIYFI